MTDTTGAAPVDQPEQPVLPLPVQKLTDAFGEAVQGHTEHRGQITVVVDPARIVDILLFLRDDPDLRLDLLSDVTAVDYLDLNLERMQEGALRFGVIWQLYSLPNGTWLRLKGMVGTPAEEYPVVPSVTDLYPGANWAEREVYDMYGIKFAGHPNLTRLLTADDWLGHPLRKDYPLIEEEIEFTATTNYPPETIGPRRT